MHETISKIIKINEIVNKNCGKILKLNKPTYDGLITLKCKKEHVWETHIGCIKQGTWCPYCAIENKRIYILDCNFFSRDNEESFYIAGFIAADGWVINNSKNKHVLGIQLSTKDLHHLERINNIFKSDKKINIFTKESQILDNKNISVSEMCGIEWNSKQMVEDLERFGIVPAKTYKLYIPEWLKKHELVRHYLRGYIDGDGCFSAGSENQMDHVMFCMRGTADFLNDFKETLTEQGILLRSRRKSERKVGKRELMFDKIQFGGNGVISRLYDYLYTDATIFLERKEEIARRAKELKVYCGGTKPRKPRENTLGITPEKLLEMAKEYGSQKKIAQIFGCTSANISWLTKHYNIREEFKRIIHDNIRRKVKDSRKEKII